MEHPKQCPRVARLSTWRDEMIAVVIGQDGPNAKALRAQHRAAHLRRIEALNHAGRLMLAGPFSDGTGSLIVFESPSLSQARAWIAEDPYVIYGIFASCEVRPFKQVFPQSDTPSEVPPASDENILLEFSMSPLTMGESVGAYVARSLDIIDKSGLPYRLNPMGTVIEGPWDSVMTVVKKCLDRMRDDCNRISTLIKIDYRKGASGRLTRKTESVEAKLGRKLST